jgi:alpha-beta hydrolase superfamily lysophospholipase
MTPRTRRSWRQRAAIAAALLLASWLLVTAAAMWQFTRRPRPRFEEPPPPRPWGTLKSHTVLTMDGERLGAWLARRPASRVAVLLLHGHRGSRTSSLGLLDWLATRGYSVLGLSMRAHGDSSGATTDFGWSARLDVLAAIELMERELPGQRLFVVGGSMGAAAPIFAAKELGNRVSGYFLEAPYKDLLTAARLRIDHYLPWGLTHLAELGLRLWANAFLPVPAARIDPFLRIAEVPQTATVVLVAGGKDRRVRPGDVQEMFLRVASHGRFLLLENAGHSGFDRAAPDRYFAALIELLGPP